MNPQLTTPEQHGIPAERMLIQNNTSGQGTFPVKAKWLVVSLVVMAFLLIIPLLTRAQDMMVGLTSNGGAEGSGTLFSIKSNGTGFSILKGFADWGKNPSGNLVLGNDGNYYGMAVNGGTYNSGTVFKVTPAGAVTVLHHFNYATDGGNGYGSLTKGADGNFYGVTSAGGINSYGTIFRITPTGVFTVLRSFLYATDGAKPRGHLVLATDGNFYGITYTGGAYGYGTIFKMTPAGAFTTLKSLNYTTEGGNSYGSLVQGKDGLFYGITFWGGTNKSGTIFKITSTGALTVLRHLNALTDGGSSQGTLVQATDGNFYGMNYGGGKNYNGTIFKISSTGAFTVLRNLSAADGAYPYGSLTQGSDGNLYGMATNSGAKGYGTIFKITPAGAFTVIRSFDRPTDGATPYGSLLKGKDGNFYGMTSDGGKNLFGTIFKVTPTGVFTVLTHFNGASQGNTPFESVIQGTDNAYYGTTSSGGAYNYGTIFKLCGGTLTNLRSLNRNTDGGTPKGSLVQGKDGIFYGMTSDGGTNGVGTIFKITSSGSYTVLRHLKNATDGAYPQGSLVQGTDGAFYGMTNSGGTNGGGTIFKITATGTFTVLRYLSGATDGSTPEGNLTLGKDGNFYGMTTYNTRIFKITPTGTFTVLRTLLANTDGSTAVGSLVQHTDGNFYGATTYSGKNGNGTIFKITPTGTFTVLRHLTAATDGNQIKGSLVRGTDGNLYGLAGAGGTNKAGTLFKISTTGAFSVLRHFNLTTDGGAPFGSLLVSKYNLVANAQSVTTTEDTPKAITLTGTGSSPLTYNIISGPKNGTLSGSGANRTYTPKGNYSGSDSFTFTVSVGCQSSAPATVNLTIGSVNDAPVLAAIGNKTVSQRSLLSFTATATDPDAGQTRTFSLVTLPAGAAINATTGAFSWTPTSSGSFIFKVRVVDNGSPVLSDEEQITVTVLANRAPVLAAIGNKTTKQATLLSFTATATDPDAGQTRTFALVTPPAGAAINATTGAFSWKPAAAGSFTFKVKVTDNGSPVLLDEEQITVTVTATVAARLEVETQAEEPFQLETSLYPNPAIDKITVTLNVPADAVSTTISDAMGNVLHLNSHRVVENNQLEVEVAQFTPGLYLLHLQTDRGLRTLKFVKR